MAVVHKILLKLLPLIPGDKVANINDIEGILVGDLPASPLENTAYVTPTGIYLGATLIASATTGGGGGSVVDTYVRNIIPTYQASELVPNPPTSATKFRSITITNLLPTEWTTSFPTDIEPNEKIYVSFALVREGSDTIHFTPVLRVEEVPSIETPASIKQKYESNSNTNAFTDLEKTKLDILENVEGITQAQSEAIHNNQIKTQDIEIVNHQDFEDNTTITLKTYLRDSLPTNSELASANDFVILIREPGIISGDLIVYLKIPTDVNLNQVRLIERDSNRELVHLYTSLIQVHETTSFKFARLGASRDSFEIVRLRNLHRLTAQSLQTTSTSTRFHGELPVGSIGADEIENRSITADKIADGVIPSGTGSGGGQNNVNSDWDETDESEDSFILNKPDTITDAQSSKLAGIEANAKDDQTPTEIKDAIEGLTGNARLDADALQNLPDALSDAEIKTQYERNTNTNAFTDDEQNKLDGIEDEATSDQSAEEIKQEYESNTDRAPFTPNLRDRILMPLASDVRRLHERITTSQTGSAVTKINPESEEEPIFAGLYQRNDLSNLYQTTATSSRADSIVNINTRSTLMNKVISFRLDFPPASVNEDVLEVGTFPILTLRNGVLNAVVHGINRTITDHETINLNNFISSTAFGHDGFGNSPAELIVQLTTALRGRLTDSFTFTLRADYIRYFDGSLENQITPGVLKNFTIADKTQNQTFQFTTAFSNLQNITNINGTLVYTANTGTFTLTNATAFSPNSGNERYIFRASLDLLTTRSVGTDDSYVPIRNVGAELPRITLGFLPEQSGLSRLGILIDGAYQEIQIHRTPTQVSNPLIKLGNATANPSNIDIISAPIISLDTLDSYALAYARNEKAGYGIFHLGSLSVDLDAGLTIRDASGNSVGLPQDVPEVEPWALLGNTDIIDSNKLPASSPQATREVGSFPRITGTSDIVRGIGRGINPAGNIPSGVPPTSVRLPHNARDLKVSVRRGTSILTLTIGISNVFLDNGNVGSSLTHPNSVGGDGNIRNTSHFEQYGESYRGVEYIVYAVRSTAGLYITNFHPSVPSNTSSSNIITIHYITYTQPISVGSGEDGDPGTKGADGRDAPFTIRLYRQVREELPAPPKPFGGNVAIASDGSYQVTPPFNWLLTLSQHLTTHITYESFVVIYPNRDNVNFPYDILDQWSGIQSLTGQKGDKGDAADSEPLTNSQIKTQYEANANTNAFTDATRNKLNLVEPGATRDQSSTEIRNSLQSLTGDNRLQASAIRDLPTSSGGGGSLTLPALTDFAMHLGQVNISPAGASEYSGFAPGFLRTLNAVNNQLRITILKFDDSRSSQYVPNGATYDAASGEIIFPLGIWIICTSVDARPTAYNSNSDRVYFSLAIYHGENLRHGDSAYLRNNSGSAIPVPIRPATGLKSLTGVIVQTDSTTPTTIRGIYGGQGSENIRLHAGHMHAVWIGGAGYPH